MAKPRGHDNGGAAGFVVLLLVLLLVAGAYQSCGSNAPTEDGAAPSGDQATPIQPTDPDTGVSPEPPTEAPAGETLAPLAVYFLDVGQGDAALLSYTVGGEPRFVLIDTGTKTRCVDTVLPRLRSMGVTRLEAVVITHMHNDHTGGLFSVLDEFPVGELVLAGYFYSTSDYFAFTEKMRAYPDVSPRFPTAGSRLDWSPDFSVDVLWPREPFLETGAPENDNSVVLLLTHGNSALLFTGDVEAAAENLILQGTTRGVDVLKVPHHGSGGASSSAFLAAFTPKVSIISCGLNNRYGHPAAETVGRLQQYGTVYRTDLQGEITVVSDGLTVSVSAAE